LDPVGQQEIGDRRHDWDLVGCPLLSLVAFSPSIVPLLEVFVDTMQDFYSSSGGLVRPDDLCAGSALPLGQRESAEYWPMWDSRR
jgi:hypothetical protein